MWVNGKDIGFQLGKDIRQCTSKLISKRPLVDELTFAV